MTGIFGGNPQPPAGGNPDSNTLISDMTTVICLDDYHALDRNGRKVAGVTALAPEAQNFDLMAAQVGMGVGWVGGGTLMVVVWPGHSLGRAGRRWMCAVLRRTGAANQSPAAVARCAPATARPSTNTAQAPTPLHPRLPCPHPHPPRAPRRSRR